MPRIVNNNHKSFKAFSLIELSIVILIIGILVAGVTQSSRLVKRIRLVTAQNITNSSPVPTIKDLALWYESSLDRSFNDAEEQDLGELTMWYDNNPQTTNKINAFPPLANNRPKYIENGINGLPSVRLAGVDDYLRADQVGIFGPQLTYFIVARRIAWVQDSSIINGTGPSGNDYTTIEGFTGFYEGGGGGMIPEEIRDCFAWQCWELIRAMVIHSLPIQFLMAQLTLPILMELAIPLPIQLVILTLPRFILVQGFLLAIP